MYKHKKKNGKMFTSKSVWTGPSSYEKRIYRAAVSKSLRNTALKFIENCLFVGLGNKMYKLHGTHITTLLMF